MQDWFRIIFFIEITKLTIIQLCELHNNNEI
jgi:hypothetical protein